MNRTAFLITTASVMAISTSAFAQVAPGTEVGEIVVTGTRIIRDGYEAPVPVTVVTAENLRLAAPTTLADALNQLPQFTASLAPGSRGHTFTSDADQVGNFLVLRNLGANRTLVMVDGRRLPPTTYKGLTDSGVVPEMLVERVDVVTGGVSAVYGSDAVAGVVNYVLDKRFEGLKFNAQGGVSNYSGYGSTASDPSVIDTKQPFLSDGKSYRIGLALGTSFADDRAHFIASFERSNQDPVRRLARPLVAEAYHFVGLPGSAAGTESNPYFLSANVVRDNYNYTGYFVDGPIGATDHELTTTGALNPYDHGIPTHARNVSIGGSGRVTSQDMDAISGLSTNQGFSQLTYDVSDDVEATLALIYSKGKATVGAVGASLASFRFFDGNPFFPDALQQLIDDQSYTGPIRLRKRLTEFTPGNALQTAETYTITGGLNGQLGDRWNFDIYYSYGEVDTKNEVSLPESRMWYAALDVVVDPATGENVCNINLTHPGVHPDLASCVPFNPFGLSQSSLEAREFTLGSSTFDATHKSNFMGASISGNLFEMPGGAGPVSVAAGVEYRDLKLDLFSNADPDEPLDWTGIRGFATGQTTRPAKYYIVNIGEAHGSTDVKEVFGEIAIPLVREQPGMYELELSGAVRRTNYEFSGVTETWKAGLSYQPVEQLRFRGAISRDIRAPTLFELFSTETCNRTRNFVDPLTLIVDPILDCIGGNPNVLPEIGKTKTLGVVYQPLWAPGLGLSVDYYDIKITGAIGTLNSAAILQDCHDSGGTGQSCTLIERSLPYSNTTPANFPNVIHSSPLNLSLIATEGVDFDLSYNFEASEIFGDRIPGNISLRAVMSYVDNYKTQFGTGDEIVSTAGFTDGEIAKWKGRWNATYSNAGFTWNVQARSISKLKGGNGRGRVYKFPDGNGGLKDANIPLYVYWDTTFRYRTELAERDTELFLTINNVFNKIYPLWPGTGGNPSSGLPTIVSVYDIMLRYYTAGIRVRF